MVSEDADAWYKKGNTFFNSGKYEEAIEAYDKAIEIKPDYPEDWSNLGTALSKIG
jgi:tetratricopeptide (TPR) repeat protein